MAITRETSVPPLPATLTFTSDWTSGAIESYRVALNLSPGTYQLSVLPDLIVLTTAVGPITENDVNQFIPEVLVSSAIVTRTVNWYDSSGVFHPGDNQVVTLDQTADTIATGIMNASGVQADVDDFYFYTATFTIEPERTITYPSGARDVYTSDYYLNVWGWNVSYPQEPSGVETALSGRVLVATGNPTGQRTTAWGEDWLNIQSLSAAYDPPASTPTLAQVATIPDAAAWTASADGSTCVSPSFNYDSTTQDWSVVDMPASPSASDLAMLQGTDRASYLAALGQTMAWAEIGSRYGGAPDIVQSVYGSASTAASLYAVETTYTSRLFSAMADAPAAAAFGTNYATVQANLDLANQELRADTTQAAIDAIVDAASRNTFIEFIVNFWRSAKLIRHQSTESYTLTTSSDAYAGGTHRDTMIGSALADEFSGGADDDMAFAGEGNDRLRGDEGNDSFDGGSGLDTATYGGAYSRYTIGRAQDAYTVSDGQQTDGIDTLTRIERLQFLDAKIALDIAGNASACFDTAGQANAGQVYRLYQAAFNRVPDKFGLAYWIGQADADTPLTAIAAGFTGSVEFGRTYGNVSDHQFVDQLYLNVLHRPGESAGTTWWYGQLDNHNMTRQQVLVGFSESNENQAALIGTIGNGIDYTT